MFCTKRAYTERADKRTANRGAETTGKEKSITRLFIQEVKCSEERHATGQSPDFKMRRIRSKKNENKKEKEKKEKKKKEEKTHEKMSVAGRIIHSAREASPIPQSHFCGEVWIFSLSRHCPLS